MLSIYLTTIFLTTRYDSTRPRFAASSASLFAALQEVTSWETNGGTPKWNSWMEMGISWGYNRLNNRDTVSDRD